MFHDQLMKDGAELQKWHRVYGKMADAIDVALGKFLEVVKVVEDAINADGKDIHAVPQMLMYEFADCIDGASALARIGASRNCSAPLRTGLELSLGIKYILEDAPNYERKVLAYECFHILDGLRWAQKCDPDHPIGKQIRKELEGDEHPDIFDIPDKTIDVKAEIAKWEKKANSNRYAIVRTEIDRIKLAQKVGSRTDHAGNWYSLWNGPKDIRALAKRVNCLSSYETLYRRWSNTAHGEGALKRVGQRTTNGNNDIHPLRSPVLLQEKCIHACFMTTGLIRTVADKLVPQFRQTFRDWWINHMKPAIAFLNSVNIKG